MNHRIGMAAPLYVLLSFFQTTALAAPPAYVDAVRYAGSEGRKMVGHWMELEERFAEAFDDICMDTFCEGDYANLTPLRFQCSVNRNSGELQQCVWVFAGSAEFIDGDTGQVQVDSRVFTCPIAVNGRLESLMEVLHNPKDREPGALLQRRLPGLLSTLYSSLSRCL